MIHNYNTTHRDDIKFTRGSSTTDQGQMKQFDLKTQQVALYRLQEADMNLKITRN